MANQAERSTRKQSPATPSTCCTNPTTCCHLFQAQHPCDFPVSCFVIAGGSLWLIALQCINACTKCSSLPFDLLLPHDLISHDLLFTACHKQLPLHIRTAIVQVGAPSFWRIFGHDAAQPFYCFQVRYDAYYLGIALQNSLKTKSKIQHATSTSKICCTTPVCHCAN